MLTDIKTIEDVHLFAKQLIDEELSFHPDDDFRDYINLTTNQKTYDETDANLRNELMDKCFTFCKENNLDIYKVMLEYMKPESGSKNTF